MQEIIRPPNLVSVIRVVMAPVLFALAFLQLENWFLATLLDCV